MTQLVLWLLMASEVTVESKGCALETTVIQRLAALELSGGPDSVRLVGLLSCSGDVLEVRVDDPVTDKTLLRRLALSSLPSVGRERFIAIELTELVHASWSELLLPGPRAETSSPDVRAQAKETLPSRRFRVVLAGAAKTYVTRGVLQGGGSLRAQLQLLGPLGVSVDLSAEHGVTSVPHGTVALDSLSAGAFITGSVELMSPLLFTAGLGARAGGARLLGQPTDPAHFQGNSVSSALLGPAALLEVSAHFGHFELSVAAEGGVAVVRLEGLVDSAVATGLTGGWVTATLGVGVRL